MFAGSSGRIDRGGCGHARLSFRELPKRWLQRPERAFSFQTFEWEVVWSRIAWLFERSRPSLFPVVDRRSADVDGIAG